MSAESGNLLPELLENEFAELKRSIADRGVLVPVVYDQHGSLVDGFHRVRACTELGITEWPSETVQISSEEERKTYAIALNLYRRTLTLAQRRGLIAELRSQGLSIRAIADKAGVSRESAHRATGVPGGTGGVVPLIVGNDGRRYPARKQSPAETDARRARIAEMRAAGRSWKHIAEELGIAETTVGNDIRYLRKYGVPNKERPLKPNQLLGGLRTVAFQVQSLAEVLAGELLGSWKDLYDRPDAAEFFDLIEEHLPVVASHLKRALRERGNRSAAAG